MPSKVLFISHDASRTGAPIVLLHLLKWIKANSDLSIQILLGEGGELEPEFKAIAPVFFFNKEPKLIRLLIKALNYLGLNIKYNPISLHLLKQKLSKEKFDLIYANTALTGSVLEFLSEFHCPAICHVHELDYILSYYIGLEEVEKVKRYTCQFIAVSEAVKNNLVKNHNVESNKIEVIYGFIPMIAIDSKNVWQTRKQLFEQLNIPNNAKIICASGTYDWRKGAELFIQLAHRVFKHESKNSSIHFLWIGGEKSGYRYAELSYDIHKLGLEKYVHFLGSKTEPLNLFAICDLFVLTSREDPYPLVCLEAASLGKPIICFDNSGGEKEFVEDDCGFVVPYLDLETMAFKIINLLTSPELCQSLGQRARQKVGERHHVDITGAQILKLIKQTISVNSNLKL